MFVLVLFRAVGASSKTVLPPSDGAIRRSCSIAAREVGQRFAVGFDVTRKPVKPAKTFQFLRVSQLGRIESPAQYGERLIVGLQRNREWMTILAAVRE